MTRIANALGDTNRPLLVVTIVVTVLAAVSAVWCERRWSAAAQEAEDAAERELREMIDTYRGSL
jgi:type II secretory pathway pseudopilin PulG